MNKEQHEHIIAFHVLRTNLYLGDKVEDWFVAMKFYCLGAGINFIITAHAYAKWIQD